MVTNFLLDNWVAITAVLGPIASYIVGRKTREKEIQIVANKAQSGELVNVQDALGIYRGMLNDLKEKLDEVNIAYEVLEQKLTAAEHKEAEYIDQAHKQELKIESLGKENIELIKQIRTCDFTCPHKP